NSIKHGRRQNAELKSIQPEYSYHSSRAARLSSDLLAECGDNFQEFRWLERFGHVHLKAFTKRERLIFASSISSQGDGGQPSTALRGQGAQASYKIVSVAARHSYVTDNH